MCEGTSKTASLTRPVSPDQRTRRCNAPPSVPEPCRSPGARDSFVLHINELNLVTLSPTADLQM